jgi:hypothetical protein
MVIGHSRVLGRERIVDQLLFGVISGATTDLLPTTEMCLTCA